ncbi:aspartate/glutamate racemase family protein [Jiangella gansuensis]|uniref:aspartate/glutamate racemase family protein n=1 Tax=Jiangella gansuensis TaxID=281473 RepID=UPI000478771B|nr:aspartate/glutamate racemase family protein [Jiangella gansuensis]
MTRVGLVHTVPSLGPVFHDLVSEAAGDRDIEPIHVTDPWLLRTALSAGVTPDVVDRLAAHVAYLRERGAAGVLVTCSSLGEASEQVLDRLGDDVPVVRVDQGMADRAVELAGDGGRVAVLATAGSTVGPTRRLVQRSAEAAGIEVTVEVELLEEAAHARDGGDGSRHDALVAEAVGRWARPERSDVVVLAQASMAAAARSAAGAAAVPVLSSPELAARRLVDVTTPP